MIKVNTISKTIQDKCIYSDINIDCPEKCVYLLVGANGVGKTSVLKTITGLYKCDSGSVDIAGRRVSENFIMPENVGVFFDTARMIPHSIVEGSVLFYAALYGKNKSDIAPLVEILHLENEMKKEFASLSSGNKRKVSLLISLLNNPDVLIWDEPFASLDPEMCCELVELIRLLKTQGKTFLITTNDLHYGEEIYDKIGFFVKPSLVIEKTRNDLLETYHSKSLHDIYFLIKENLKN